MGPIPVEWGTTTIKRIGVVKIGLTYAPADTADSGTLVLRASNIQDGCVVAADDVYVSRTVPGSLRLQEGDILICVRSGSRQLVGKCARISKHYAGASFGAFMSVLRSPANPFLFWVLSSNLFDWLMAEFETSTINQLTQGDLKNIEVPFPPLGVQRAIADFLDKKTAAIDAVIAKKERLIELLQEKRQALITQAVTEGLDPDVPMKDSGVEWLGEIPAHWEVLSLTRVVQRFVDYRGRTPDKTDEGVPLITAGAVRNGRVEHGRAPEFVTEEVYQHLNQRGQPEAGDILFTSEAPLGEVGMVEDPRIACAQRIIMFKVDRAVMKPEFLLWYLLSAPGRTEIVSRASGSTAEGIRADRLRMAAVLVPPLAEQERCVVWLRDQVVTCERIEPVLSRQIDRLREYRQALITGAVTGKLDIAQEADRDPEVMVGQALEAAP